MSKYLALLLPLFLLPVNLLLLRPPCFSGLGIQLVHHNQLHLVSFLFLAGLNIFSSPHSAGAFFSLLSSLAEREHSDEKEWGVCRSFSPDHGSLSSHKRFYSHMASKRLLLGAMESVLLTWSLLYVLPLTPKECWDPLFCPASQNLGVPALSVTLRSFSEWPEGGND